jgi:hypothetical protein
MNIPEQIKEFEQTILLARRFGSYPSVAFQSLFLSFEINFL